MIQPTETNITAEDAPEVSQLKLGSETAKPAVNEYSRFLARRTTLRTIDGIRGLIPLEQIPGVISLLAGKPNRSTFPIEEISITMRAPAAPQPYSPSGGEPVYETLKLQGDDLSEALQYTFTDGIPKLKEILSEFQRLEHGVVVDDIKTQLTIGNGGQDVMYKIFMCLLDPGDPILLEAPIYAGVLPILQPLECEMVEVETDPQGISVEHLRELLKNWPEGKPKPKALYTVPFGNNPTGATTFLERRQAVLELAEEHDFIILEDDPYYYLYFGNEERPPSYLSLENSANRPGKRRVLRFDSFSKVLSSGMRIGFATGPPPLIKAMNSHTSAANLQAASTTQAIALAMLRHWGHEGFRAHISNIAGFYRAKRDAFDAVLTKYFKPEGGKPLAEWTRPEAGLFFWFKLNIPHEDSAQLISTKALAKGVIAVPGVIFFPNGRRTTYVRTSFSVIDIELVEEALKRLASVVREVIEGA